MKYRKRPVVVEAVKVSEILVAASGDWSGLPAWVREYYESNVKGKGLVFGNTCIYINTLEGEMVGDYADYIIHGVNGEIYPCKADIFEKTYDAAE